jgi:hypothetical protein
VSFWDRFLLETEGGWPWSFHQYPFDLNCGSAIRLALRICAVSAFLMMPTGPGPTHCPNQCHPKFFSIFAAVGQSLQSSRARNSGESSQQKSLNMISNFRQTLARVKKKLAWGRIWKPFELGDCSISSVISSG